MKVVLVIFRMYAKLVSLVSVFVYSFNFFCADTIRMRRTIDKICKKVTDECEEYNALAKLVNEEEIDLNNASLRFGGMFKMQALSSL